MLFQGQLFMTKEKVDIQWNPTAPLSSVKKKKSLDMMGD